MIWIAIGSGVLLMIVLWSVRRRSRRNGIGFWDALGEMDLGDLVSSGGESIGDIGSSSSDGGNSGCGGSSCGGSSCGGGGGD